MNSSLCSLADDIITSFVVNENGSILLTIIRALVFAGSLPLAFAANFGKRKTLSVAYGILAMEILYAAFGIVKYGGGFDSLVKLISSVIIACVVCMFVMCKYSDKDARRTT